MKRLFSSSLLSAVLREIQLEFCYNAFQCFFSEYTLYKIITMVYNQVGFMLDYIKAYLSIYLTDHYVELSFKVTDFF